MEESESDGVRGAVFRENLNEVYLLGEDLVAMAHEHTERFNAEIAELSEKGVGNTESGALHMAALVGASAAMESLEQNLDLLCIEIATNADEMIYEEEHQSG